MILQVPVPPTPPTPPSFDPNLLLMEGGPGLVLVIVLAALAATVIILLPIMRAFGRRLEARGADPALKAELDQLHARLGELDSLHAQILELEERVDFAERLLSQTHDAQKGMIRGDR